MWSPKRAFPSQRNTNRWKILVANFSFRNRNEENMFGATTAIFLITKRLAMENHDERIMPATCAFRATTENVSSQLYTFSCAQLKNGRLVLCCVHSDLSFRVLSRRSRDRHVARTKPKPCNISRCSPLNRLQNARHEKPLKITRLGKLRTRALYIRRVAFFRPASHCSQL